VENKITKLSEQLQNQIEKSENFPVKWFDIQLIEDRVFNTTEMDSFLETFSRHGPTVSSF
jgi:hypothetical protein